MEAPIVIEILDRFGKIRERHKVTNFPVRVGRAYSNDIIIDDNYVSPEHIEILLDGDGHVLITDLNSENGLFSLHPIKQHEILTIEENQRIRIGHTDIRIRSESYTVKETYVDHGTPSVFHFLLMNGFMVPFFWLITAGVTLSYYFLRATREITTNSLLSEIVPLFIFIIIWALGWSVVSKVTTHKFYFSYHAILISLIICGFYIIEPGFEYIEFLFPVNNLSSNLSILSDLVLVSLLFYGHLRQSTNINRKRTRQVSVIATVLIIGLVNLTNYLNQPEFDNDPGYSHIIKSPIFFTGKSPGIDDYFASADKLKKFDIKNNAEEKPHQ